MSGKTGKAVSKFKVEFYVDAYRLAKEGLSDTAIATALGISHSVFSIWLRRRPGLADAVAKGRQEGTSTTFFKEVVHGRLTGKARELWEQLEEAERAFTEGDSRDRIDQLIQMVSDQGERVRQHLFIHALLSSNFQISTACRRLGIAVNEVTKWMGQTRFADLIAQVHQCKKDFFEGALIDLVRKGDSPAVIFVNKTVNKDRGYSDKLPEDETRKHEHIHRLILDDLPADVKRVLLDSVRRKQVGYNGGEVLDAEVE